MDMNEIKRAGTPLQAALAQRSAKALMAVLDGMDASTMAGALEGAGFAVPERAKAAGRQAIFTSVKADLQRALQHGMTNAADPGRLPVPDRGALDIVQEVL